MAKSAPQFNLSGIKDAVLRENFEILQEFIRESSPLLGFRFVELTFDKAVTNFKYKHGLGFVPKDILQTSKTGVGVVTFNYSEFSADSIDISVTGACVVRFFAGTYNSKP
jgi:hypothetical protein